MPNILEYVRDFMHRFVDEYIAAQYAINYHRPIVPLNEKIQDLVTEAIEDERYTGSGTHVMLSMQSLIILNCATEEQHQLIRDKIHKEK